MTDDNTQDVKKYQNGLLDILLNGLSKSSSLESSVLGKLSQVSKIFQTRLKQDFIWQQLLEEDIQEPTTGPLSAQELCKINAFIRKIPVVYPCAQPQDSQGWAEIDEVPREMKSVLRVLHSKIGSDLMTYVEDLYALDITQDDSNARDLLNWLKALRGLYDSAKESVDLFHGLFLNNHNFARRGYQLAKNTSLEFSTDVLQVCAKCRFSSLTMSSKQLDDFFTSLAELYATNTRFQLTETDIQKHIQNTFYPKTFLVSWNKIKFDNSIDIEEIDIDIDPSNEITATPSL